VNGNITEDNILDLDQQREKRYLELGKRMEREKQLKRTVDTLYVQKQLMKSKKPPKKLKTTVPGNGPIYKWTKERKR